MALIVPLAFIIGAGILGITAGLLSIDDGPLEEVSESILETNSERLFGLEEGSLDFDLTPDSPELKEIAALKAEDSWTCHCVKSKQMDE